MTIRMFSGLASVLLLAGAVGCQPDADNPTGPATPPSQSVTAISGLIFRQVSAGGRHTCGVTTHNQAYCWGANGRGQLGDGTTTSRLRPRAVVGGLRFRQVSAGADDTCGVTTDDKAYCWGWDESSEFGTGSASALGLMPRPVPVTGGHQFRQVAMPSANFNRDGEHTCALTTDNRAYCWGDNFFGALGIGPFSGGGVVNKPTAVVGGHRYRDVSPGVNHTCGVTFEDRVLCWGFNFSGELGNGGHDLLEHNTPAPVQIVGLLFRQVSAGGSFYQDARDPFLTNRGYTCALTTEAHAYCWGDNKFGQLGDGTGTDRSVPTAVWGNRRFRQISAGPKHVCAVKYSGAAYCWGRNPFGDLGDGTSELQRVRPVPVQGGLLFTAISAGDLHVTDSGSLYCWGNNEKGQLGDGTTTNRPAPTLVSGSGQQEAVASSHE